MSDQAIHHPIHERYYTIRIIGGEILEAKYNKKIIRFIAHNRLISPMEVLSLTPIEGRPTRQEKLETLQRKIGNLLEEFEEATDWRVIAINIDSVGRNLRVIVGKLRNEL